MAYNHVSSLSIYSVTKYKHSPVIQHPPTCSIQLSLCLVKRWVAYKVGGPLVELQD